MNALKTFCARALRPGRPPGVRPRVVLLLDALLGWLNDHQSDACFVGTTNDVRRHFPKWGFLKMALFGHLGFQDYNRETRSCFWAIMTLLVASSHAYSRRANASVARCLRWTKLRVVSRSDFLLSCTENNRRAPVLLGLSNALILPTTYLQKPRDLSRKHADWSSSWLDSLVGLCVKEDLEDLAVKPIPQPSSAS